MLAKVQLSTLQQVCHYLVGLTCNFLMTYRATSLILVYHLCIVLVKYLLRSHFGRFLIGLFIFLMLSFKSSLYILDSSLLSDVSLANIFSQAVACLLIPLIPLFFVSKTNLSNNKYWVGQRLRCYRKAQTKFLSNPVFLCPSSCVSQRSKSNRSKNI